MMDGNMNKLDASPQNGPAEFSDEYYTRYQRKNIFGFPSGQRKYLYHYWKRFLARRLNAGSKVLDVGCGLGFFSKEISSRFNVQAIDSSLSAISQAKKLAPHVHFSLADGNELGFQSEEFEAVAAFDVLEHQEHPQVLLKEMNRVLKPEGWLIVSMPNMDSIGRKARGDRWYAILDPTHVSLLDRAQWIRHFELAGFEVLRIGTDFLWDIPYVKWIPSFFQRVFCVGLQWVLVWTLGPLPWKKGETLFFIVRKARKYSEIQ